MEGCAIGKATFKAPTTAAVCSSKAVVTGGTPRGNLFEKALGFAEAKGVTDVLQGNSSSILYPYPGTSLLWFASAAEKKKQNR